MMCDVAVGSTSHDLVGARCSRRATPSSCAQHDRAGRAPRRGAGTRARRARRTRRARPVLVELAGGPQQPREPVARACARPTVATESRISTPSSVEREHAAAPVVAEARDEDDACRVRMSARSRRGPYAARLVRRRRSDRGSPASASTTRSWHVWEPYVDPFLRCNIWLVVGRDHAMLVDTGLGLVSLAAAARDLFDRPLLAVATHYHFDHVGSLHEFPDRLAHRDAVPLPRGPRHDRRRAAAGRLRRRIVAVVPRRGLRARPTSCCAALPVAGLRPGRVRGSRRARRRASSRRAT